MKDTNVQMGKMSEVWRGSEARDITFCVTEDCNLACKYCYMTGKNQKNKMTFDVAKRAVDYILANRDEFNDPAVVWTFIGGEPFLEIKLIDKICDYIKQQMFKLDHPWFSNYRFSFSTNGLLYHTEPVQNFIRKNKGHLSIGISLDGNKIKHDMQRIKIDGTGSYEDVVSNVPLWLKQFPNADTKATFAHDDLPYLKDSIIHIWNLDIKTVAANVVFEDVWQEGDDIIFENQLKELADYILEKEMWREYSVRFFSPQTGTPVPEETLEQNFCGSGKMLAIDCEGNFYPCVRFYGFSLNNRDGYKIGNIHDGINNDRLRPFVALKLKNRSTEECINCDVGGGCAWCTGYDYDCAYTDTLYQRATFVCKMHKANARANKYFWDKFAEATGIPSLMDAHMPKPKVNRKFLQFITSDNITPHCLYRNTKGTNNVMDRETLNQGLDFARVNGFIPVILGKLESSGKIDTEYISIAECATAAGDEGAVAVFDNNTEGSDVASRNRILLVNKNNIEKIFSFVKDIYCPDSRINLVLEDINKWNDEDLQLYTHQLDLLVTFISEKYADGMVIEINVLTDILSQKSMCNCDAGVKSFALAPNGRLYMCPAFYFDDPDNHVGTLEEGINIKNAHLLELGNSPVCSSCDAFHCKRCKYMSKKMTSEYHIPSRIQCVISHTERNKSRELQMLLKKELNISTANKISEIDYLDPMVKIKEGIWRD